MQSKIVALLAPEGSREAALLMRRADGQFALARIDARLGAAARLARPYANSVNYPPLSLPEVPAAKR
jgi:hypothetical protein